MVSVYVIYPGKQSYPIDDKIQVLSILDLPAQLATLG